ncbi:MAG: nucleotidyltransferase family protein [Hyphomicrobiaceae bacterium]
MTSWRPATAMVLAAGLGVRMRPLTDTLPKPLVVLAGKPLIDHVLDRLTEAGIARAVVNVHHHADRLENHLKRRVAPHTIVSDERTSLLETGGGVLKALPLLGPEPFLIHNSDSLWIEHGDANLVRLAEAWEPADMDSLLLVARVADSLGYGGRGDFTMTADGLLRRRIGRDAVPFVFAGASIAHPRLFAEPPPGAFSLNILWDRALARGRLYGLCLEGTWMHVGTPAALAEAERILLERYEPGRSPALRAGSIPDRS